MALYDEAMAAWERSKQPAVAVTRQLTRRRRKITVTTDAAPGGDAACLEAAMGALADTRKILGLNAPLGVALKPIRDPHRQQGKMINDESDLAALLAQLYVAGHPRIVDAVQAFRNRDPAS